MSLNTLPPWFNRFNPTPLPNNGRKDESILKKVLIANALKAYQIRLKTKLPEMDINPRDLDDEFECLPLINAQSINILGIRTTCKKHVKETIYRNPLIVRFHLNQLSDIQVVNIKQSSEVENRAHTLIVINGNTIPKLNIRDTSEIKRITLINTKVLALYSSGNSPLPLDLDEFSSVTVQIY